MAWLCCTITFGSQVLAEKVEKRSDSADDLVFLPEDFDLRPDEYQWDEEEDIAIRPLPIPEVLSSMKAIFLMEKDMIHEGSSLLCQLFCFFVLPHNLYCILLHQPLRYNALQLK